MMMQIMTHKTQDFLLNQKMSQVDIFNELLYVIQFSHFTQCIHCIYIVLHLIHRFLNEICFISTSTKLGSLPSAKFKNWDVKT